MSISTNRHSARANPKRFVFKLHPVAAGCAALVFGIGHAAYAQQAEPAKQDAIKAGDQQEAPIQTVTVSGIRRGIESAILVKKNSDAIVETISAEDLGKLPDISIAESISRLPGLSAQRVNGQAQQISIRGTAPELSSALLNGREQVSTSGDRVVEFDQYPSELMSAVTVYKTGDAAVMGQGLAGTVNLQTINPLDYGKRAFAVNVRGEKNSNGKLDAGAPDTGNRVSLSYIDQFVNKTVGVAFGFAHSDHPVSRDQFETWNWVKNTGNLSGAGASDPTALYPQGIKGIYYTGAEKRDGVMGVVEWRPSKSFTSTLDMYHSKFNYDETRRGMEVPYENWSGATFNSTTITNGLALQGTMTASPVVRNNFFAREDNIDAFGWNNKLAIGKWTTTLDLSHSKADHSSKETELNASLGPGTLPYGYTGPVPEFTFAGNLADPAAVKLGGPYGSGYYNQPTFNDKLTAYRLDTKRDLDAGILSMIEFGVNLTKRDKTREHLETGFGSLNSTIAASDLNSPTDLSRIGLPNILSWNVDAVLAHNFAPFTPAVLFPWGATKNWTIKEDVTTGYSKLDLDGDVSGVPMRGNVGVQVVHTDQSSTSNTLRGWPYADLIPVTDGKAYTDILPSLNLAFTLSNQQIVRFGAGRSLARPKLDDLNASFQVGLSASTTGVPQGTGGNAKLDPWKADYLDLSYEKYFGNKGYVSAAAFHKDLKSYIYTLTTPYDFSGFPLTGVAPDGTPIAPSTNIGTITRPENGQGGKLDGIELAASLPLEMLSPALDGFGIVANLALTNSSISIKNTRYGDQSLPLPGLSKNVLNLTAYYEKNGFSARISQRKRSDFIGSIGGPGGTSEIAFIKADTVVDFQTGYEFETGSYKGLSVLLQVNNLTDAAYQTYSGSPDRYRAYEKFGRQMMFGLNYKM